jgi:hypothetical protein
VAVICAGLYPTVVVPLQIAYFGKPRPVSTFCVQADWLDVHVSPPPPASIKCCVSSTWQTHSGFKNAAR